VQDLSQANGFQSQQEGVLIVPVVFSPGEPETRPLDPEAIVYTTGNKIGQLLGIAAGEPVDGAADAASTGFYITGTDLREHGFESGDTILVYSDLDPLGTEFTITAPVVEDVSGTKYVKLPTTIGTHANYTTAANTVIQNKTIFTNGKSRGVTKDIINTRIREIQDRIDNYTHNAWRPYLAAAEYINFDTYKPYRRRYYTDYVGTTPLLFRNVQQMLRIEIWQGEDYTELCGAEARVEVVDHNEASSFTIFMSPGGGGFAKLGQGSGTQQWNASFNRVTTAQNIADLINKENRVNRGNVTFTTNADSPNGTTYTLPDGSSSTGTSSVHLHNEFIASANADYGNGKIKITSMQPTKGGEQATIVLYDSEKQDTAMTLSQVTTVTKTMQHSTASGGTFAVAGETEFADYGVAVAKKVGSTDVSIIGYTGKTFGLNVTGLTGVVLLEGDAITNSVDYTVTQHKFKLDLRGTDTTTVVDAVSGETPNQGIATGDQARLRDWWIDHEMGIVYFNNSYPFFEFNAVKVTYIYGERYVEKAIEEAATKLVASELLMADDRSVLIPEGTQNIDLGSKAQLWRREAMDILSRYKEVVAFV